MVDYDIRPTPTIGANIFPGGLIAGKDGVSVVDAEINANGELILILSDGSTINAGVIPASGGGYNIGNGLKLDQPTNTLSVDAADAVEEDNTKPITAAAVYAEVGNINALLETL